MGGVPRIIGGSLVEHREETRRRLFEAFARLLEDRGFDAVTLAEVAAEAGIGRTAVYNHVPDKETLLLEYIAHLTGDWLSELERALDGVEDPVERLRVYVRHQLRMRRTFHMPVGLRAAVSPDAAVRLREHAAPVETALRQILADGIAAGVFVAQPIDVVVGLVNACLTARVAVGPAADEDSPAATEAFVLRAVGVADA
jgi:AcrR family transcriptional regulator